MQQIIKTVKSQQSTQNYTTPLMTTKSMVESAWAEEMRQFLYHLDPLTRKYEESLKNKSKDNKQCSIVFNKTCLNNNLVPKYTLSKKNIYVYFGSISSLIHISLNIIDIFVYIFFFCC